MEEHPPPPPNGLHGHPQAANAILCKHAYKNDLESIHEHLPDRSLPLFLLGSGGSPMVEHLPPPQNAHHRGLCQAHSGSHGTDISALHPASVTNMFADPEEQEGREQTNNNHHDSDSNNDWDDWEEFGMLEATLMAQLERDITMAELQEQEEQEQEEQEEQEQRELYPPNPWLSNHGLVLPVILSTDRTTISSPSSDARTPEQVEQTNE